MSQAAGAGEDLELSSEARSRVSAASWAGIGGLLRPLLMLAGLVATLAGAGGFWLAGGRIVSIDDAGISVAKVVVATDVSGIVADVAVKEGQQVHKGDVLVRLNDRAFRIALAGAQADLARVRLQVEADRRDVQRLAHAIAAREAEAQADRANYARYANLVHGGAVTAAETDTAKFKLEADQEDLAALRMQARVQLAKLQDDPGIAPQRTPSYQLAQARVDEAQRQLDHTVIRAPFDGVVTQVDSVQPGMYLAAAAPAFALVSTDHVWATANPKETELTWVKPGDPVRVHVDTYPGIVFTGAVESIAPASGAEFALLPAQNTSGNWVKVVQRIPLRIRIDRKPDTPSLRAGMSVTVDIDTGHIRHLSDLL
jgi:membrane fusion protein (multidrug efflux system)